jgi:glutamate carboxypeptidase
MAKARSSTHEMTADAMLAGIRTWVEIESQTADVAGVNQVMSQCAADYEAAGAIVSRIPGRDGYGDHLSIRSPWGGSGSNRGILVLCHLDTVHPKGTLADDLPFRVEGDRAYGPGIYDMKGGAYLTLAAFRSIAAAGTPTPLPLHILIVSDEEVGSPTSRPLIEAAAREAKYVLVTEPARDGGRIVTARKGVGRYDIGVTGRPAHSGGRHQDGRSAIVELARQIIAIEDRTDYKTGITFNIGTVSGGTAENVVPAKATASIDVRVRTLEQATEIERWLMTLQPHNPDCKIEVRGALNRPPYEKNDGVSSLFAHARRIAAEDGIGIDLVDVTSGGGSDGNFTAKTVPTLDGLGIDGDGAHTLHEHMLVSALVPRMRLQKRLLETLE